LTRACNNLRDESDGPQTEIDVRSEGLDDSILRTC